MTWRGAACVSALLVIVAALPSSGGAFVWRHEHGQRPRGDVAAASIDSLVALGRPIYCGGARHREIALTFDDGPGPWTQTALRILRRAHDHATFFVVGKLLGGDSSVVREEARRGNDVGDHTWTHANLALLVPAAAREEIRRTAVAIGDLLERRTVFFRSPYGVRTPALDRLVRRLRLLQILWSVDSRDAEGADPAQIAANILAGARPGAIVLMHENRGQTLKALLAMHTLAMLRARGFRAVTLTQLLTTDPPTRAQVAAGRAACGVKRLSRGG